MPAQWTADFVGKLHANRIKQNELASYMGLTPEYVCMVLAGKREPRNAEQNFRAALDELIHEKQQSHPPIK